MAPEFESRASQAAELLAEVSKLIIPWIQAADDETSAHISGQPLLQSRMIKNHPAAKLDELMALSLPEDGLGNDGLLKSVESILEFSVNTFSPGFVDKLYASTNAPGLASEMLLSSLNTNTHVYRVSPALTLIEKRTTTELARIFGLTGKYSGGISQPGGSTANLTSLVVARNTVFPDAKRYGLCDRDGRAMRPVLFTSSRAHYSFEKAAQICGLGSTAAISVPSDENGCLNPAELERLVIEAKSRGQAPFYVAATSGTTVIGAFDPLCEIASIAKRHRLWFHVDAAWGGSFIFSDKLRTGRLNGTELADSITYNPHKMLGVPLPCSFLLVRDLRQLQASNSLPAGYLFHNVDESHKINTSSGMGSSASTISASSGSSPSSAATRSYPVSNTASSVQNDFESSPLDPGLEAKSNHVEDSDEWTNPYDLGDLTLQCGRRGDSLKFFLSWQYYGTRGFQSQVENAYTTACDFAEQLRTVPDGLFKVVSPAPLPCLQVCFYYSPGGHFAHDPPDVKTTSSDVLEQAHPDKVPETNSYQAIAKLNSAVTRGIADKLISRGFLVDYAPAVEANQPEWCGDFFRLVVNVQTRRETLERLMKEILEIGKEMYPRR